MGQHRGIHCYTVGQRKGVGVAGGKPLYVVRVERGSNRVVLGEREDVMTNKMFVQSVNWLEDYSVGEKIALLTQIRYNHAAGKSIVRKTDSESAEVEFAEPQFAITPGQAAVFYDGEQVVGGGWIS